MKKLLVCATVAGLAVGVYCLLCRTKKGENVPSKWMERKSDFQTETKEDTQDVVKEMHDAKENSAQAVYERHTEAAGIMADAFTNIMKEVEPIKLDEKSVEPVIDTKDVEIIQDLNSLSDDLDELLK